MQVLGVTSLCSDLKQKTAHTSAISTTQAPAAFISSRKQHTHWLTLLCLPSGGLR